VSLFLQGMVAGLTNRCERREDTGHVRDGVLMAVRTHSIRGRAYRCTAQQLHTNHLTHALMTNICLKKTGVSVQANYSAY